MKSNYNFLGLGSTLSSLGDIRNHERDFILIYQAFKDFAEHQNSFFKSFVDLFKKKNSQIGGSIKLLSSELSDEYFEKYSALRPQASRYNLFSKNLVLKLNQDFEHVSSQTQLISAISGTIETNKELNQALGRFEYSIDQIVKKFSFFAHSSFNKSTMTASCAEEIEKLQHEPLIDKVGSGLIKCNIQNQVHERTRSVIGVGSRSLATFLDENTFMATHYNQRKSVLIVNNECIYTNFSKKIWFSP